MIQALVSHYGLPAEYAQSIFDEMIEKDRNEPKHLIVEIALNINRVLAKRQTLGPRGRRWRCREKIRG